MPRPGVLEGAVVVIVIAPVTDIAGVIQVMCGFRQVWPVGMVKTVRHERDPM